MGRSAGGFSFSVSPYLQTAGKYHSSINKLGSVSITQHCGAFVSFFLSAVTDIIEYYKCFFAKATMSVLCIVELHVVVNNTTGHKAFVLSAWYFYRDFNQVEFPWTIFHEVPNIKFFKNLSNGGRVYTFGGTDRHGEANRLCLRLFQRPWKLGHNNFF